MHHSKCFAAVVDGSTNRVGADATFDARGVECRWAYAGSHNLSFVAWGRIERNYGEDSLYLGSWELGVLLLPPPALAVPAPRPPSLHVVLPWVTPPERCAPRSRAARRRNRAPF